MGEISEAADRSVVDLAERLGLPTNRIDVVTDESVTWPDASLGCPRPGRVYAPVLTPGRLVVLTVDGASYEYHAGNGRVVLSRE